MGHKYDKVQKKLEKILKQSKSFKKLAYKINDIYFLSAGVRLVDEVERYLIELEKRLD